MKTEKKMFVIDGQNKHILGGYFNMARFNFYKTIMEIFAKVGIKGRYGEDKIDRVLDALYKVNCGQEDKLDNEQQDWANNKKLLLLVEKQCLMQKLLFRKMPFFGPMMANRASYNLFKAQNDNNEKESVPKTKKSNVVNDEDLARGVSFDDCLDVLRILAACLNDCRDYYTHFNSYNTPEKQKEIDDRKGKIAIWLDDMFTASRRVLKTDGLVTKTEMEFLTGTEHYYQDNVKDEKGKIVKDKKGRPKKIFVEREDYYFRIIKTTEDNNKVLSDFGVVYFCAIFLSKTYAKRLIEEIKLMKYSKFKKEENEIVREMMSLYRIRLSRGKQLDVHDTSTSLALDMLNELRRCPKELYDVIGKRDKKKFEDKVDMEVEGAENEQETVARIRYSDRFPYLVMKYIDENELFERIRFHIRLGNYRFEFYNKTCINGDDQVRSLQKEINGFGRIQQLEEKRKEMYKDMFQEKEYESKKLEHEDLYLDLLQNKEDTIDTKPYITDHEAYYNIFNNRIGLYWENSMNPSEYVLLLKDKDKKGLYLPSLAEVQDGRVDMPAPKAMLSVFDFPAMMFYEYLQKANGGVKVEDVIINKYNALKEFFSDVYNGKTKEELKSKIESSGLRDSEIPEKLRKYLSSEEYDHEGKLKEHALGLLKSRYLDLLDRRKNYEQDRKRIGEKDNKYGKKGFRDVRHGKLAIYLSQSVMDWLPKDSEANAKLTGLNYSKLQAFFATYGPRKTFDELDSVCKEAHLDQHPFLKYVLNKKPNGIEPLYLAYINSEIIQLEKYLDTKNLEKIELKEGADFSDIPFIHHDRKRWGKRDEKYYRDLAGRYEKEVPMNLPDGLFTPYILNVLKEKYADNDALQDRIKQDEKRIKQNERLNGNAAYLISLFFECVLKDGSQEYYTYKRSYELFEKLNKNNPYLSSVEINERLKRGGVKKTKLKPIQKEIKNFVDAMQEFDSRNHKTLQEAQEAMKKKLTGLIQEVKMNERAIRRYKTEDAVLFLMAKQTLSEANLPDFMLMDVFTDSFLNKTVNFEFSIKVDKHEMNDKRITIKREIKIKQEGMSLKNYGKFHGLLTDDRLPSLLNLLLDKGKVEVEYNSLWGELTSYDISRSSIFKAAQDFEKQILELHPLNDPNDNRFYIDNDPTKLARRNNFRSLLELLDGNLLSYEDKELIISIRNAFCHNHYPMKLDVEVDKTRIGDTEGRAAGETTTIATLIKNKMKELCESINLQINN